MNKIKKIPALTLSELLVVLLITVIVVGMAFSVLNLVQRHMHGIDGHFEQKTELNLLRQSLWSDFHQAGVIWFDPVTDELFFVNGIKEVRYEMEQEIIIKEQDTFHVQFDAKKFLFKGEEKHSGEIDALDFSSYTRDESRALFVFKRNAATSYINN